MVFQILKLPEKKKNSSETYILKYESRINGTPITFPTVWLLTNNNYKTINFNRDSLTLKPE